VLPDHRPSPHDLTFEAGHLGLGLGYYGRCLSSSGFGGIPK